MTRARGKGAKVLDKPQLGEIRLCPCKEEAGDTEKEGDIDLSARVDVAVPPEMSEGYLFRLYLESYSKEDDKIVARGSTEVHLPAGTSTEVIMRVVHIDAKAGFYQLEAGFGQDGTEDKKPCLYEVVPTKS